MGINTDAFDTDVQFILNTHRGLPKDLALQGLATTLANVDNPVMGTQYSAADLVYLKKVYTTVRDRIEAEWEDDSADA